MIYVGKSVPSPSKKPSVIEESGWELQVALLMELHQSSSDDLASGCNDRNANGFGQVATKKRNTSEAGHVLLEAKESETTSGGPGGAKISLVERIQTIFS